MNTKNASPKYKTVNFFYALMIVGALMSVMPVPFVPLIGSALLGSVCIISLFYFYTTSDVEFKTHCRYINSTFLWGCLFLLIGTILFGSIVVSNGDLSAIYSAMDAVQSGVLLTEADVYNMQGQFVQSNHGIITVASMIGYAPFAIYTLYRSYKGLKRLALTQG